GSVVWRPTRRATVVRRSKEAIQHRLGAVRSDLEHDPVPRTASVGRGAIEIPGRILNQAPIRVPSVAGAPGEVVQHGLRAIRAQLEHRSAACARTTCARNAAVDGGAVEVARRVPDYT